jgi:nifR3 family TIM-barrel protein
VSDAGATNELEHLERHGSADLAFAWHELMARAVAGCHVVLFQELHDSRTYPAHDFRLSFFDEWKFVETIGHSGDLLCCLWRDPRPAALCHKPRSYATLSSMQNFWPTLKAPFFVMAPMEDVTDAAFRRMFAKYGKPDVTWTEFTSADGLVLAPEKGQLALRAKLLYTEEERPIVAQLFSSVPERMEKAARICAELGFDGVDINMGCPDRSVEKGGAGAALIKSPALARELIAAAQRGVCSCAGLTCTSMKCIPVSVKTRIGYNQDEIDTWIPNLLSMRPAALTVHLRTRKEMSEVPAHWELMPRIAKLRAELAPATRLLGNGDIKTIAEARERIAAGGCDGAMIGRGIFGNPWLFAEKIPTPHERIAALIEHITLFDEILGHTVNFATMKKHFKAYIQGWDHAKELRVALMETEDARSAIANLRELLSGSPV